jgi:protein TonB
MQPKTNRTRPDRIILFEIGSILALLFVNYMLNFQYGVASAEPPKTQENPFTEKPYVLGPLVEPKTITEPKPQKTELIKASVFDARALIKQVDEFFKAQDQIIAPPSFTPPAPMALFITQERIDSSSIVHDFSDQMPEFPGGERELIKYIVSQFDIPDPLFEFGNNVKLDVEFVVDQYGDISDFKILNCTRPGFGLEDEAKRVYTKMPKWTPGTNRGRHVNVRLRQPIQIQLN